MSKSKKRRVLQGKTGMIGKVAVMGLLDRHGKNGSSRYVGRRDATSPEGALLVSHAAETGHSCQRGPFGHWWKAPRRPAGGDYRRG